MKSPRLAVSLTALALALGLSACSSMESSQMSAAPALKDGELAMPANYTAWPVFMAGIQKKEAKQIRDIYVNKTGTQAKADGPFPNGTEFVMEIYSVKLNADGTPALDTAGNMSKDKLTKVFLMTKGAGWGESAPAALKNGDWIYTAFEGNGTRGAADQSSCRACHLPLADKDFVFHYDAWFKQRAAAAPLAPMSHTQALAAAHTAY
jgi:hemoglobin